MLAVRDDRWFMKCNECPVRMDVAPARMPEEQVRTPSGWIDLGDNAHACPQCAPRWMQTLSARPGLATRTHRRS
jgi:hypothetical protein